MVAWVARVWLWPAVAAAALLVPAAFADHSGCPLFERLRYDFTVDYQIGGDLVAVEHVVGFTDFRECYELRDRVTTDEIRFEARGGRYDLHLEGEGIDEWLWLEQPANSTPWYPVGSVALTQYVGLSHDLQPTLEPGIAFPGPRTPDAVSALLHR